jgi:hypothetical protein
MANLDSRVTIEFKAFAEMGTTDESGRKTGEYDSRVPANANKEPGKQHILEWPSTPKISQSIEVNYSTWELQHTNYQPSAFGNRSTPVVTISGPWFSRTEEEAKKTLTAIHLLRSATSMFYGRTDKNKGTPPPIGRLSAHGLYSNTPVVVKTFQYDYPNDVDYITVDMFNGRQSVPVLFEMSVSLIVQINAVEAVKEYTLENFYTGKLLGNGYI